MLINLLKTFWQKRKSKKINTTFLRRKIEQEVRQELSILFEETIQKIIKVRLEYTVDMMKERMLLDEKEAPNKDNEIKLKLVS